MPKARERIVVCDCRDCVEQPDFDTGLLLSPANEAVAKQLPPPKCLWICLTGVAQPSDQSAATDGILTSVEATAGPHINRLCKEGGLGLVSFRQNFAGLPEQEVAQLLGVSEVLTSEEATTTTLQKRFKNMQVVFDSNSAGVVKLGPVAGMDHAQMLPEDSTCSIDGTTSLHLPDPEATAKQLLLHLGLASDPAPHPDLDLVLLHVDAPAAAGLPPASTSTAEQRYQAGCATLEWADQVLKNVGAEPAVRETVLVVMVLTSAGQKVAPQQLLQPNGSTVTPGKVLLGFDNDDSEPDPGPPIIRPLQSFETLGGEQIPVDLDAPALVIRRLAGVIRRDRSQEAGFREAVEAGVHGCILADRLLHEIAYKVARAPKYGA